MLKDWIQDSGTTLSYTDQAGGSSNYNDKSSPDANMIDGDSDSYSVASNSGAGGYHNAATLVATFNKAVNLTEISFKYYVKGCGPSQFIKIWVYDGSWTCIHTTSSAGTSTITETGSWSNITKVQFTAYEYCNDPIAWTANVKFYEAKAWGTIGGFANII